MSEDKIAKKDTLETTEIVKVNDIYYVYRRGDMKNLYKDGTEEQKQKWREAHEDAQKGEIKNDT